MSRSGKNPWDRRPDESDEQWIRFLYYRNLVGSRRHRSVNRAYRQREGRDDPKAQAPQSWWNDYHEWDWKRRVDAYEIRMGESGGPLLVTRYVELLLATVEVSRRAMLNPKNKPKSHLEARETTRVIGAEVLTPETIIALLAHARGSGGESGEPQPLAELPELPDPVHEGSTGGGPVGEAAGDRSAPADPAV